MKTIRIQDATTSGILACDLKDVLSVLGLRALRSTWIIAPVDGQEDFGVDIQGEAADELESYARDQAVIDGARLKTLAKRISITSLGDAETEEWQTEEPREER
jgi:hypothetical protein